MTTKSATKLDWEYEKKRPAKRSAHGRGEDDPLDRAIPPEQEDDEHGDDRHDEVAAVQARILEERRHAEERRVGIGDLESRREEQRAGLGLPEADRREERAEPDERREERSREATRRSVSARASRARRRTGTRRRRARSIPVARPTTTGATCRRTRRTPRPGGRAGTGGGQRLSPRADPEREREHGRRDHEVQRSKEERLLVTELDRDPEGGRGEQGDGEDRGIARERDCAQDRADDAGADERDPGWSRDQGARSRRGRPGTTRDRLSPVPAVRALRAGALCRGGSSTSTAPSAPTSAATLATCVFSMARERYVRRCSGAAVAEPLLELGEAGRTRSTASGFWSRHFPGRGSVTVVAVGLLARREA